MRFMKLNINKILYLIPAFVLALAGCNKQPVLHELNAPADQMKITPSATELVLQRVNAASEAVTFSWGDAADRGEDTKLTYYFRLYQTVNKDNQSELIRLDEGVRSISFTTAQLNEIIASRDDGDGSTFIYGMAKEIRDAALEGIEFILQTNILKINIEC